MRAVVELDGDRVGDRALVGIVVVARELLVLDADDLVAQRVDARVGGDVVLVVGGGQAAEDQRHGDHVLDAVVAVGRIVERALLVDDADRRLVRADRDLLDVVAAGPCTCGCSCHRAFDRGLRVELGGEGDLEQHVLHHVAAVRALELERLALEQHVVEAPGLRGQHRRDSPSRRSCAISARRTARDGGVAGRPALARAGVRRVAVGAQRSGRRPRRATPR